MYVLFLLAFHNLQGLHNNNWKKKTKKGSLTIVIKNTLKVITVLRRNYFKLIVGRRKKRINKIQKESIYTRN